MVGGWVRSVRWHQMSRLAVALATVVLLVVGCVAGRDDSSTRVDGVVKDWLSALAGAQADRGWHFIGEIAQDYEFQNDRLAYVREISAVDWTALNWSTSDAHEIENSPGMSWWAVYVLVEGGLEAVPGVLFHRGLAQPLCIDDEAPGFLVIVEMPMFGPPTIGGGAMTGTAREGRCGDHAAAPPEQFLPGSAMTWTGHELEVWNWTELPLFLLHESGQRFDIGPCQKGHVDGFSGEVAIRAEDGYVATFGWETQRKSPTFVVIGSRDVYLNNAPPQDPMPPCEGEPQVQPGV